jgi:uncharacterized membrane protein
VLGMFVATFTCCLTTALSIPTIQAEAAVPQIAVTFGMFLMLLTFASLIILIQHISLMLQAPNIVAAAGSDLRDVVGVKDAVEASERPNLKAPDGYEIDALFDSEAYPLQVSETGYIQFVDPEIILNLAKEKDLVIRLLPKH